MRWRGFTLLEMVVAIFIFGLVGLLAIQLLTQSVRTTEKVIFRSTVVGEWHRAMNILDQDFLQMSARGIRDEFGDVRANLLVDGSGLVEMTRSGWVNPLGYQRSDLQRVSFMLYENQLFRRYWNVLDRSQDSQPVDQLLLRNVRSLRFDMIDKSGREHGFWPPLRDPDRPSDYEPLVAVRMTLDVFEFGAVTQTWIVPEEPFETITPVESDEAENGDDESESS